MEDLTPGDIENFFNLLRSEAGREDIELALQIAEANRIPIKWDIYKQLMLLCRDIQNENLPDIHDLREKAELTDLIEFVNSARAITLEHPHQIKYLKYYRHFNSIYKIQVWSLDITQVPEQLQYYQDLQHLNLGNNKLEELPDTLHQLKQLSTLNLYSNRFKGFSALLFDFPELTELQLGANYLKFLPKNIGQLQQLTYLGLTDNQIERLPDSFFELKNLEVLSLTGNPIPKQQIEELQTALPHCSIYFV